MLTAAQVLARTKVSSLEEVRALNLVGVGPLREASVLARCTNLTIASLTACGLRSLAPFAGLQQLQQLYLRKNEVASLDEVAHLQSCSSLRHLWLADNAVASLSGYRAVVAALLPQLINLDGIPLHPGAAAAGADAAVPKSASESGPGVAPAASAAVPAATPAAPAPPKTETIEAFNVPASAVPQPIAASAASKAPCATSAGKAKAEEGDAAAAERSSDGATARVSARTALPAPVDEKSQPARRPPPPHPQQQATTAGDGRRLTTALPGEPAPDTRATGRTPSATAAVAVTAVSASGAAPASPAAAALAAVLLLLPGLPSEALAEVRAAGKKLLRERRKAGLGVEREVVESRA